MIDGKEKNFISVVLYVHDSAEELQVFFPKIYAFLDKTFEQYELICVNDASTDGSREVIEKLVAELQAKAISIINMSVYQGRELSMNAGVDLAIGDFVYEFDSLYLDYEMELVMDVYWKALEGYDIVAAAPVSVTGRSSKLFYKIFNKYNLSENDICQESFCILSRRALNRVKSLNRMLVFRKAVYANCGLNMATITYENVRRKKRTDKKEKINRIELAIDSLILFTNAATKFSLYICLFFLGCVGIIGVYTWASYFSVRKPVEGWTPIMLFLALGFFGIFLLLTIIFQYLSVILKIVFRRQKYLIESIDKITNS